MEGTNTLIKCIKPHDAMVAKWKGETINIGPFGPGKTYGIPDAEGELLIREGYAVEDSETAKNAYASRYRVLSDAELSALESPATKWIVKDLVPERGITIFAGKRSSMKTWAALQMAITVAAGKPFMANLPTTQKRVLYIDEETGEIGIKQRVAWIKKGLSITENLQNLYYLSLQALKIDNQDGLMAINGIIHDHKFELIIIDTMRRVISVEENDATQMNDIFTETIRPLAEKYGLSLVLLHHMRKGDGRKGQDEMDELRGSSEIANYADSIVTFTRLGKTSTEFIVRHVKSRCGKEMEPFKVDMDINDERVVFENRGTAMESLQAAEQCRIKIMVWLEESNIAAFKTRDAVLEMKKFGFLQRTVERALGELKARGDIVSPQKGNYIMITSPPSANIHSGGFGGLSNPAEKPVSADSAPSAILYRRDGLAESQEGIRQSANTIKVGGCGGFNEDNILEFLSDEHSRLKVESMFPNSGPLIDQMLRDGRLMEPTAGRLKKI